MFVLYGLAVSSDVDLPGFAETEGEPDVVIRWGTVPRELDTQMAQGVCFQVSPGRFLLQLEGVARYSVTGGREVTIDRAAGAADEDVRTFLLGTVFASLLYQRGLVPFHASGILTKQGAVLFGGRSGAGKSTLAAAMARRGHPVITDDVAPVAITPDGIPVVYPGSPSLWLWSDALSQLGIPADELRRVRPRVEKHVWASAWNLPLGPHPVVGYYRLDRHNQPGIILRTLEGMERVKSLNGEIYRAPIGRVLGTPTTLFRTTTALAQQARVVQVCRPGTPYLLEQLVDAVLADLECRETALAGAGQ